MFSLLFKKWKELLILGLVATIFLMKSCGNDNSEKEIINVDGKDYELLSQKIDTVVVEKEVKVPTYVPKYIEKIVTETVEVEIPMDVDSLAIIKDYFSKYQVKDTLRLTYDFPKEVTDSSGNKPSGMSTNSMAKKDGKNDFDESNNNKSSGMTTNSTGTIDGSSSSLATAAKTPKKKELVWQQTTRGTMAEKKERTSRHLAVSNLQQKTLNLHLKMIK